MDKLKTVYKIWINVLLLLNLISGQLPTVYNCLPSHCSAGDSLPVIRQSELPDATALAVAITSRPEYFSASPITPEIDARIRGVSYPDDCPVPLSSLRYLTVLHIGFDGLTHVGEMIVHEQIAEVILDIFYRLYLARYPIEKIRLIDDYQADDEASMADNNTSAFCCRTISETDILSVHSYGLAVDINPLYNPYIRGELISPASAPYDPKNKTVNSPYFMTEGDYCVQLFLSYGFTWGGMWDSPVDYQHFEYSPSSAVSSPTTKKAASN